MNPLLRFIFKDSLSAFDFICILIISNLGSLISPWLYLLIIPATIISSNAQHYMEKSCTASD